MTPDNRPTDQEEQFSPPPPSLLYRRWWFVPACAVLLLLLSPASATSSLYRPLHLTKPVTIEIRRGASIAYIARRLQQRKLIPSALTFRIYARLAYRSARIQVGEYDVVNGQRPVDILKMLFSGRARAFWLTIPEGKWASEIVQEVAVHWPAASCDLPTLVAQPGAGKSRCHFRCKDIRWKDISSLTPIASPRPRALRRSSPRC